MNILFLSHYFVPEGNAPASRVHALCKRWVDAGHEVTVVTCAPNVPNGVVYPGYRNSWRAQEEVIDGIRVIRVWTYIAANKGTGRRILNYLSYMVSAVWKVFRQRRPDLVIATSPQFFCGWAGVITSRLLRVPLVLEIRDIWPESITAVGAMKNQRMVRFLEWLEAKMYRAATLVVTVGEGYRQRLLEKGVPREKLEVVMNGLDSDLFQPVPADQEFKKQWGLDGKFVCSYLGTIGMACGLDVTLRAASRLREMKREDIVFLLVGDGAVQNDLKEQADQEGLDNVIFTGRQDKDLMPDFLASSDACLVHLRKSDLFTSVMPSKIFEAAGMARPIINAVNGFAADFVEDANAGVCIEPEDEDQLVEAVTTIADSPALGEQLGQSGYEYVNKHFNRDSLARDYLKIIYNLVDEDDRVGGWDEATLEMAD